MPAHNEEPYLTAAVEEVVAAMQVRNETFEVIVCENGSADHTATTAADLARAHPDVVKVIRLPEPDYGQALRAGFLAARGDYVINFDVDLVDLGFYNHAIELATKAPQPDIIVGSKRSPGAQDQRPAGRQLVSAIFAFVLRTAFKTHVSDTHGVKLLRRVPLLPLVAACRFGGDIFDTELVIRAERAGLTVNEIPVTVTDQRPPRTSITSRIPRSLLGLARLWKTLYQEQHHQLVTHRPHLSPGSRVSPTRESPSVWPQGSRL